MLSIKIRKNILAQILEPPPIQFSDERNSFVEMREELLQHIWLFRLFNHQGLQTTDGTVVEILHTGELNRDAGPDFFNARIKIGETLWAGNLEIHIRSSDWNRHGHQNDRAYDNVILHVVAEHDMETSRADGSVYPTLLLSNYLDEGLKMQLNSLSKIDAPHSLSDLIGSMTKDHLAHWLDVLLRERLAEKSRIVYGLLERTNNDWEYCAYCMVLRSFGMKVNQQPFEMLAYSLSWRILGKHANHLEQVEALLFGQSGLLSSSHRDEYAKALWKEYSFLKKKYDLSALEAHIWKFGRLRPANFPTIRIAQLAQLFSKKQALFSKFLSTEKLSELLALFELKPSTYWQNHFRFDQSAEKKATTFGSSAQYNILINAVIPLLYAYGKFKSEHHYCEKAIAFLEEIPPENNRIVRKFTETGMDFKSAAETQAILQLRTRLRSLQLFSS